MLFSNSDVYISVSDQVVLDTVQASLVPDLQAALVASQAEATRREQVEIDRALWASEHDAVVRESREQHMLDTLAKIFSKPNQK